MHPRTEETPVAAGMEAEPEGRAIIKYTHAEFLRDVLVAAQQLTLPDTLDDHRPAAILCLARGGLTFAAYLAHRLGIKQVAEVDTFIGDTPPRLIPYTSGRKYHYVLVDDISDSGETMLVAKAAIQAKFDKMGWDGQITTASLWIRETTKFVPDIFARVVHGDAWISFPWENELQHSEMGYFIEVMDFQGKFYDPGRYLAIMPMSDEDVEAGKTPRLGVTDVLERASVFDDAQTASAVIEDIRSNPFTEGPHLGMGTLILASHAYNKDKYNKFWRTYQVGAPIKSTSRDS